MDARAVLMVYSEEHDGAFWTEHGSPELCVPALARWIEACRRSGELPSAANYWEHIQADFVDQFTSTASCWDYVQAEHIADLD